VKHGRIATIALAGALVASLAMRSNDEGESKLTTIYIVRHAEKVDESQDAALSDIGKARAATLAWMLRDVAFDAAYSTDYQRTRDTIGPLVGGHTIEMDVSTPPTKLAEAIRTQHVGQTIVVCGHSNTVPMFLRDLGVAFPDDLLKVYDDLFVVTLAQTKAHERPAASLQRLHYPGKH
jgi:broad specificity phosphatase PhoE